MYSFIWRGEVASAGIAILPEHASYLKIILWV